MNWGERLKEERKRLKIKQKDLALKFDMVHQTILQYEKGLRSPNFEFLNEISRLGFDIQYILTGVHSENCLSSDEKEILFLYQNAPDNIKKAAKAVLLSGETGTAKIVDFGNSKNLSNIKISQ